MIHRVDRPWPVEQPARARAPGTDQPGYFTATLPVKKNGAVPPKQKTVTFDPFAKPLNFPTPGAKAPVLKLKPESNPKQVQFSPAGTVTVISPVVPAVTLSAGTAAAVPPAKTIAGAMTADAMAVRTAIFFFMMLTSF